MKFSEFLKKENILEEFLKNCKDEPAGTILNFYSFVWKKNNSIWEKLDNKWSKIKNQEYDLIKE